MLITNDPNKDSDLGDAFHCGFCDPLPQGGEYIRREDILVILGKVEGDNDWEWLVRMKNGSLYLIEASCCWHGWGACQDYAAAFLMTSLEEFEKKSSNDYSMFWRKQLGSDPFAPKIEQEIEIPIKNLPITREIDVYLPKKLQDIDKWVKTPSDWLKYV